MTEEFRDAGEATAGAALLDTLVALGCENFELLHDEQDRSYGRAVHGDAGQVFPIPSEECARRLQIAFKAFADRYPTGRVVKEAMEVLAAVALHEGPCQQVHVRVGETTGGLVLDLADNGWTVCVTVDGWKLSAGSSVYFRRRGTALKPSAPHHGRRRASTVAKPGERREG